MIEIKELSKSFGLKQVLDDVTLQINEGQVFGLVGINGAGKSTLLRLISGVYKPDCGSVYVDGENVFDNPNAKSKIFFLPDEPFYGHKITPKNIIEEYKVYYDLNEKIYFDIINTFKLPLDKSMFNFSKGMKRQVFIALAIAIRPKYLLLDEAFDGLDPLARMCVKNYLLDLTKNGSTVIISSHSLRELSDICSSYGLIDNKKIGFSYVEGEMLSYHKYQVAFKEEPQEENFKFEYLKYAQTKRIVEFLTYSDLEKFTNELAPYNPLIIDEVNVDFEERFVLEVKAGDVK